MAFQDPLGSNRSAAASWHEASRIPARVLWLAGTLVVMSGILAGGIWVLRSNPMVPLVIRRVLLNEPSEPPSATPPVTAEKEPPAQPPGARHQARIAPPPPIAIVPVDAGSRVAIAPSDAPADTSPDVAKPPAEARDAVAGIAAVPVAPYTASDADVTPPEPIRQQWLRTLPAARPDDVVSIELVVSERGKVESARIVNGGPRSVGESMLLTMSLHAVKSWQFSPALKGGSPVRYRQVMSFGRTAATLPS
jgi:outer membrane biosynthesis protein TonB